MRRRALSVFWLVFCAHAFFVGAVDWNQAARIGAILTFVEPGPNRHTLRIDEFAESGTRNLATGDWARGVDGHLYSNKAPGVSLIGVPAYAVLHEVERMRGLDPRSEAATRLNTILLNLWCSVAWTAAATAVLFGFLAASGFTRSGALLGALGYAFGTLVFPYDTSLWGHPTAAACVLAALCLAWWPGDVRWPWLAGALGGLAVLCDYLAVFALAAVASRFLLRSTSWRERFAFAAGAAAFLLALLLYQSVVFGGYFTTASSQSNPVHLEQTRALGLIGRFDTSALFGLLFPLWRGLFVYCPVLLFAVVGAAQRWREGARALVVGCGAAFGATLLFLASVSVWWGGAASGPRYLIPALPLLALLAPRTGGLPRWVRGLYAAAWVLSACNMLTLAAVDPIVDEAERNPLYGFAYGRLATGHYPHRLDAGNVGVLLGLLPPWDLVAFVLAFGGWTIGLLRSTRAADRPS